MPVFPLCALARQCIVHSCGIFLRKIIEIVAKGHTFTVNYQLSTIYRFIHCESVEIVV